MGSFLRVTIAVCIVFSCPQSTGAGTDDGLSFQPAGPYEVTLRTEIRHPASRKYGAGPWPRFALEMLA